MKRRWEKEEREGFVGASSVVEVACYDWERGRLADNGWVEREQGVKESLV